MTDSATPESGDLSVEAAIASLVGPEPEETDQPVAEAPEGDAETEENTEGEASSPEEAEDGAETPAEDAETEAEPEAVAPVDPPKYWSQDAKAKFAQLPPELQAVVLQQEGPREEAAAKAKAEAAQQVEAAQKELAGVRTLAEQLNAFLPEAIQTFQQRWGAKEPDWAAVAEQYGGDEAFKLKTRYEAEQKQLAQTAQATQAANAEAQKAFVQAEWKTLADIAPELAPDVSDPRKGAETRQKVTSFLVERGIPKDAIAQISAVEMALAHDAMRWREAQAAVKAQPKPKPVAPKAPVRPAAGQASPTPQRARQQAEGRFHQNPNVENAVALLVSRNQ